MNPPAIPDYVEEPESDEVPPVEVTNAAFAVEALLRSPASLMDALRERPRLLIPLLILAIISSAIFGLVLGMFSGGTQLWAAPLKVSAGLLFAGLICFPSLSIFSCLANTPLRLPQLGSAFICFLALFGLLLIAFAPVLWIFAQSSGSLPFVGMLGLAVWLLSFLLSNSILRRFNRPNRFTPWQIHLWLLIFLTVTLQVSTALRPLLGTAPTLFPQEKKFFLTHWFDSLADETRRTAIDSEEGDGSEYSR